jgi:hypothetical protein
MRCSMMCCSALPVLTYGVHTRGHEDVRQVHQPCVIATQDCRTAPQGNGQVAVALSAALPHKVARQLEELIPSQGVWPGAILRVGLGLGPLPLLRQVGTGCLIGQRVVGAVQQLVAWVHLRRLLCHLQLLLQHAVTLRQDGGALQGRAQKKGKVTRQGTYPARHQLHAL